MTVGQYITASGVAGSTEQGTLNHFDVFMTGALGWKRVDIVTDTVSDNDRVWYSEGESPGKYMPIFLRARATTNLIYLHTYTFWNPSTQTGSDEIAEATELRIPNANAADTYFFAGNKDFVFVSVHSDSLGADYLAGGGYWDTFYTPLEDPCPVLVFGQNTNTDTFENTARVRSYAADQKGFLAATSTYSGTGVAYVATDLSALTNLARPNKRDNRYLMLKQDFYTQRSRVDGDMPGALAHEVRGEIPGLYQFYGTDFSTHQSVLASGITIGDGIAGNEIGQGDWVVSKSSDTNAYAIGPTVPWSQTPNTIPNIEVWLKADAYHLEFGNTIRSLVDISSNDNHATQGTISQQPRPVASGTTFNGQAIATLDGTDYLTGALSFVNGYTAFVVADYVPGPSRRPLLYVRGAVGADDTIFSLEFNTAVSGTAQVTVQSDAAPANIDVERYSGLSSSTPFILSAVVSGTTTTLHVNGDSTASSTITNTKGTVAGNTELNYAIGATLNAAGAVDATARHQGNIAEVIVYGRDLTNEEHQTIVCYLGDKYGITVSGTCV